MVRGSDSTQLEYKLITIQLEYEMIRSETLSDEARSVYTGDKEFAYDHVIRHKVIPFRKDTDSLAFREAFCRRRPGLGKIHLS